MPHARVRGSYQDVGACVAAVFAAFAVFILSIPQAAQAQQNVCAIDPMMCATGTGFIGGQYAGNGLGLEFGQRNKTTVTPSTVTKKRTAPKRSIRNGRRCTKVGRTRTCTYYRRSKAYRVCVQRTGAKRRCHRPKQSRKSDVSASYAADQGFLAQNLRQVGKIWKNGRGHCSATLIARGIIITAGHCVYENAVTASGGPQGYLLGMGNNLEFTPNSAYSGGTPTNNVMSLDAQTAFVPDNVWKIQRTWVPQCYADNNMQCDFALAELQPASGGTYIGDVVGSWPIRTEMTVPIGAHFFDVGYSMAGIFMQQRTGYGNAQYYCDVRWQGEYFLDAKWTSNVANFATDDVTRTKGTTNGCQHMGGASGGPIFVEMNDGSWVINGVNSTGESSVQGGYGETISWNYFGREMTNLYCYVFGCAASSALRGGQTAVAGTPGRPNRAALRWKL